MPYESGHEVPELYNFAKINQLRELLHFCQTSDHKLHDFVVQVMLDELGKLFPETKERLAIDVKKVVQMLEIFAENLNGVMCGDEPKAISFTDPPQDLYPQIITAINILANR